MSQDSESTSSVWSRESPPPLNPIHQNAIADVCIVGGGIAGLSVAYQLAARGESVIVVEAESIGSGESGRTTAHLVNVVDDRFVNIESVHGEQGARLVAESHSAAIDEIEKIVRQEQIACDFQRLDGYLFNHDGEKSTDFLEAECAAAQRAGLTAATFLSKAPDVSFDIGPCIRFPNQGQFHPLKYLAGLARAIERLGGRIHTGSRAELIRGGDNAYVQTTKGVVVSAGHIVVATNTPTIDRVVVHTKQASYRTYAIALRIPRNTIATALFWDTLDPYHYVRVQRPEDDSEGFEILIVGGEDHKTGQDESPELRFVHLEQWARRHFPMAGKVTNQWSGQVIEPVDGVAFIGKNPMDYDNVWIATGDSGMGMTHGVIAGLLLADLIQGIENPWSTLYDPSRKTLLSLWTYTKENVNSAVQYSSWLTGSDVDSFEEIEAGSGAVVRTGLTKIAVYRDEQGTFHQCSAVCPHLGGIVAWNPVEHSWDCPCHGSRFDAFGKVVNGPAASDLPATTALQLPEPTHV
jgi:glycine/D-amino acid oxidase-like deaminating enzyme/nitrite reductase/ring-hydroxylating ferredoxin subunit